MAARDFRSLGIELITGKAGGSWGVRAEKVRALMATLIGSEPPSVRALPEARGKPEHRLRAVRSAGRRRGASEDTAMSCVDALVNRNWSDLRPLLAEKVAMLWPDGSFAKHDRDELLEGFEAREGRAAKAIPEHPQSYATSELRSIVPRGVAEAIEAAIDAANAIAVTMHLDSPSGSLGSITVMLAEEATGWKVLNMPFAGIDGAYRASVPASRDDDEAVRVTDRIVRHFMYGHEKHVRSLRNAMMDRVMFADAVEPAEKLFERAADGPHRVNRSDTVFLGTERAGFAALEEKLGRARADAIKRRAKEAWGHPWERLKAKVLASKMATIDPLTLEVGQPSAAFAVAIGVKDGPREEERWRLGALLLDR